MQISEMNWMQVEKYLAQDDRCILPTGSTEQHAYLSLCVDTILAARLAREVGAAAGVPVYPVLPYGLAQQWTAFPGTISLRIQTYLALIRDVLDSIYRAGFRRILLINGHGGNAPAQGLLREWMMDNPAATVKWHNWYNAPQTWAKVQATDSLGSHASWMELPLDAAGGRRPAERAEGFDESRAAGPAQSSADAAAAGRWQHGRLLSARR